MGVGLAGVCCGGQTGVSGGMILAIAHAVVSPGLFWCVGWIAETAGHRSVRLIRGLSVGSPLLAAFFVVLLLANAGLPGLIGFSGEILVVTAAVDAAAMLGCVIALQVILMGAWSAWLIGRVVFGSLPAQAGAVADLSASALAPGLFLVELAVLGGNLAASSLCGTCDSVWVTSAGSCEAGLVRSVVG
eukprot:Lithocolla_globosa_v1_NODE_6678_length_1050_cov_1212.228141.p1 type:complete len:188 gc:universal NODE_6678_length_1050_cov_1212.228141:448-1011(+)